MLTLTKLPLTSQYITYEPISDMCTRSSYYQMIFLDIPDSHLLHHRAHISVSH